MALALGQLERNMRMGKERLAPVALFETERFGHLRGFFIWQIWREECAIGKCKGLKMNDGVFEIAPSHTRCSTALMPFVYYPTEMMSESTPSVAMTAGHCRIFTPSHPNASSHIT